MGNAPFVSPDDIRGRFSRAMSAMYRLEVPAYGTLLDLVAAVNRRTLNTNPELRRRLEDTGNLQRIGEERHGAIRLGTATELGTMRRLFSVMGMVAVGYYDLSVAGVPVHSTAFRPVGDEALRRNPFRVFTSLLRLELIADKTLRRAAGEILSSRDIFTPETRRLIAKAETQGGLDDTDADRFVEEAVTTFRWHEHAVVDRVLYDRLHRAHRLIADVVCFRGPHINHLTPRTLDIDAVQALMPEHGIEPKAVIEGPPPRHCPILLRQTAFKALAEPVAFRNGRGSWAPGTHTARFGEIEQRGVALTPRGRALYDNLLAAARSEVTPAPDGSNATAYRRTLEATFADFPDSHAELRRQRLAYFSYLSTSPAEAADAGSSRGTIDEQVHAGLVRYEPIVYEDFLPVSAAGIFQSNLGDEAEQAALARAGKASFEEALGTCVLDPFDLYESAQSASIERLPGRMAQSPRVDRP